MKPFFHRGMFNLTCEICFEIDFYCTQIDQRCRLVLFWLDLIGWTSLSDHTRQIETLTGIRYVYFTRVNNNQYFLLSQQYFFNFCVLTESLCHVSLRPAHCLTLQTIYLSRPIPSDSVLFCHKIPFISHSPNSVPSCCLSHHSEKVLEKPCTRFIKEINHLYFQSISAIILFCNQIQAFGSILASVEMLHAKLAQKHLIRYKNYH